MNNPELLSAYEQYLSGDKAAFLLLANNLTKDQIPEATEVLCRRYKSFDGDHVLKIVNLLCKPF